ncbi:oxysterol-binding protein-related protein 1B-like isoform X1 [Zingiber officinale]|uniref:oxysterol-binding protein-related protein 1B-like isoform X1 n=1 Tax=Zingiber officinale TaxID=94328 RepID=UPI001C4B7871|nr:oxysterol-binding protein-related protein 1B-like isoform X1 [Zingiber officinale]
MFTPVASDPSRVLYVISMGTREMPHPLCCISLDLVGLGARSPAPADPPPRAGEGEAGPADSVTFCGALYKWTNIRKGWRLRWFSLHDGVLSYSKIARRDLATVPSGSRVRLIGNSSSMFSSSYSRGGCGCRQPRMPVRLVQLKISSFRESKTDDRRFYIFSPKKTLHLKTDSSQDRVAWIEALISASKEFSTSKQLFFMPTDVPFSTERLKDRMRAEGLDEAFIEDCEKIIHSEFAEYLRQFKLQFEDHLNTITFHQQLEEVDVEDMTNDSEVQLTNADFSSYRHEKSIESSTTVSSDDIEKQDLDELSDEDEIFFFDANECLDDPTTNYVCKVTASDASGRISKSENNSVATEMVRRREKLPEPVEMEKCVSLWSMIKNNVGKDLSKVCLPVYFNEPLSSLQKCFEDLEYSYLLDQAYEYGKKGDSLMRILNVAAFAASGYSSCDGRVCKPFNPLLGETYEAEFPEKGVRFISEKVSHHPMLIACHCEGRGWKFWGDSNLKSKFWGQSIQLDPVGILTLEFDDGEIFQWSKVTTTIYNLIVGKVYCNHHGTMNIRGNKEFSCTLKLREQTLLDCSPRQVQGYIEDTKGLKVASLLGKWDDSMYYSLDNAIWKSKTSNLSENATLLWKRNKLPDDPTRYNLTSFAITLNELTPGLKEKLPPTDSRLRPDQRYLENGEYEKANGEKLRLEQRQRQSKKLQENGWKPRWFLRDCENGTFHYIGGYWEAREKKEWVDCTDIFGELSTATNS